MAEVAPTRAQLLALELKDLTRDSGARLAKLLRDLRHCVALEPTDLVATSALSYAVALAGIVEEIRPLAWRGFMMLHQVEGVNPEAILNTGAALSEAGYVREAKICYERLLAADPSFGTYPNMENLAVRYGEWEWFEGLFPESKTVAFLQARDLLVTWASQQAAVEEALAGRIASFESKLEDFHDGTWRLAITYFTDATPAERGALYDAVWDAVEQHHAMHSREPSVLLGVVVIDVEGPEIPLPQP